LVDGGRMGATPPINLAAKILPSVLTGITVSIGAVWKSDKRMVIDR
jgi:hypothetical protein